MLDNAEFLFETQNKYYEKFYKAIRKTGYKGPIVTSCWQAGEGIPHYYNLQSDSRFGIIDRHNYFGGGSSWRVEPMKIDGRAMVDEVGRGLLSSGLQQVESKPFAFSEWISVLPSQWMAESGPIIAAYGMGLQGWDASYQFALDEDKYLNKVQNHGIWVVNSPVHLGMYPLLSRTVLRGDIQEGKTVVRRVVTEGDLKKGKLATQETVMQQGDLKEFDQIASKWLGLGKVQLAFSGNSITAKATEKNTLLSSTEQLSWSTPGPQKGYFTVNTEATRAFVGFNPGQTLSLGEVEVTPSNPFSVIWITSHGKESIRAAKTLVIGVVARVKNTGMEFSADGNELLKAGDAPLLVEGVTCKLKLPGFKRLVALDQDGRRTQNVIPGEGEFTLDSAQHRTIYFLAER
jgi:hypothetical protein